MQGFNGGNDPANREDLWRSKFATSGDIYKALRTMLTWRQQLPSLFFTSMLTPVFASKSHFAFVRGPVCLVRIFQWIQMKLKKKSPPLRSL